jgi:hypothetical protein
MEGLGGLNASFEMIGQFGFDDVIMRKYPMLDHINHVHTPGNSSGIVDGSSAVLVGSEKAGKDLGLTPRARIVATAVLSHGPGHHAHGSRAGGEKVPGEGRPDKDDIDLWEINEAFASVALRYMKDLDIDHEITNVNGGAIAMGHPSAPPGRCWSAPCSTSWSAAISSAACSACASAAAWVSPRSSSACRGQEGNSNDYALRKGQRRHRHGHHGHEWSGQRHERGVPPGLRRGRGQAAGRGGAHRRGDRLGQESVLRRRRPQRPGGA